MRILKVLKVEYQELHWWRIKELIGADWESVANFERETDARLFARAAQEESLKQNKAAAT